MFSRNIHLSSLSQEKILKSDAWKMAFFQSGICPRKVKHILGKFHPGKWPFSMANSNLENGHFLGQDFSNSGCKMAIFQAWILQIRGVKLPFSRPGFFKLRVENDHFPGLDFSNLGWKMVIFQAWIFQSFSNKIKFW